MKLRKFFITTFFLILLITLFMPCGVAFAKMPFYGLNPEKRVLRAEFTTDYSKSTPERKHNIALAAQALNNKFIDVKAEFSFNDAVGIRSASRGYQSAKIIVKGKFIEGVGGGVCQVSTTLYNAALLSGMTVTEHHAHSLSVSYVKPSFDAMVNSGSADLKFVNTTKNPAVIKTKADGEKLTVKIYGEKMTEKILLKSVIKDYIPAPMEKIIDDKHEYSDLFVGEERIISYGKQGIKSESYIITEKNGKKTERKLRADTYSPINGTIVIGTTKKDEILSETETPFLYVA